MTTTPEAPATTLTERVAEEIRALMGRRRMTGAALARSLGRSEAWISYRLSGKQTIDLHDLEAIASALGVAPVELLPARDRRSGTTTGQYSDLPDRPRDNRPVSRGASDRGLSRTGPPKGAHGVRQSRQRGIPAAVAAPLLLATGSSHE